MSIADYAAAFVVVLALFLGLVAWSVEPRDTADLGTQRRFIALCFAVLILGLAFLAEPASPVGLP